MDEPLFLMYEELMASDPESKFLLSVVDPESWFQNYVKLVELLQLYENATERSGIWRSVQRVLFCLKGKQRWNSENRWLTIIVRPQI